MDSAYVFSSNMLSSWFHVCVIPTVCVVPLALLIFHTMMIPFLLANSYVTCSVSGVPLSFCYSVLMSTAWFFECLFCYTAAFFNVLCHLEGDRCLAALPVAV